MKMKQPIRCLAVPLAVLLGGGSSAAIADDLPLLTKVSWRADCPNAPRPVEATADVKLRSGLLGALFAAVAPKLISGAVDAAGAALTAAGQDKASTSTARTDANFYRVSQLGDLVLAEHMGCVVLERGRFGPKDTDDAGTPYFRFEGRIIPVRGLKFFQVVPVYVKAQAFEDTGFFAPSQRNYQVSLTLATPGGAQPFASAEFVFAGLKAGEAWTEKANDWRLVQATSAPMALPAAMADAEKAQAQRAKKVAPYLLAMDILGEVPPPTPKPKSAYTSEEVVSAAEHFCGVLKAHNASDPRQFALNDARCSYPLEAPRERLDAALQKAYRSAEATAWASKLCPQMAQQKDDPRKACPGLEPDASLTTASFGFFSTRATLVETRPGSRVAAFFGKALVAGKDDVSKALTSRLVPDSTAPNPAAEDAAQRAARQAVALAELTVAKAEDTLAEALSAKEFKMSAATAARIELLKAKIAANTAYRAAGLPVPYPEVD